MTENFENRIKTGAETLGIKLSKENAEKMYIFYEMLSEKNKVMNLTALTDENDVIDKHFIDSLSLLQYVDRDFKGSVLDVGTGAGFPGLVLSIMLPESHITMLDAVNKKLGFINEVIDRLSLNNAVTIHGRAEDFGHNKAYRENFDVVTARAVANLSTLCEYCIPFVKKDGCFLSYKSGNVDEELCSAENALKKLGAKVMDVSKFNLPGTDFSRAILTIKRTGPISPAYPRKAGLPSKEPL